MILFLKNIRRDLLSKNQAGRYLLYAMGEIIVVVIGILIAFQLNISKDERANRKTEISYLQGIMVDLDQDIAELNILITRDQEQLSALTTILKSFTTDKLDNNFELVMAIGSANRFYPFEGQNTVFEDMKSSGKITLISSDQLRFSILKYYNLSRNISRNQNGDLMTRYNALARNAFDTTVDLNSMIETGYFNNQWNAEVDPLELSFFEADTKSAAVKIFANRLSVMKALILARSIENRRLLKETQNLKPQVEKYFSSQGIVLKTEVTPDLIAAIKQGDIEVLAKQVPVAALDKCYYMDTEFGNYLVHAITYESLTSLKFFVEQGADLEGVCDEKTPLMYAVKYGELEMTKYLVDSGADLAAFNRDRTALSYARIYEHPEIEAYLKSVGAK